MIIKFYILGIKRNFRGESLFQTLKEVGLNVEIVWGLDSKNLDISTEYIDHEKSMFLYGRELTASEIACTRGHKMIADKARVDNVDFAVILEDDVVINDTEVILEKLKLVSSIEYESLFLLKTDRSLSLMLPVTSPAENRLGIQRIYSNAATAAAYVFNKLALETLVTLPFDTWTGVQADFPPIYFEKMKMYSICGLGDAIALQDVESVIGLRSGIELSDIQRLRSFLLKITLVCGSRKMRYGLGVRAHCAHFFGRGLAWRLNHP